MTENVSENSSDALGALVEHFPEVIGQMQATEFTSHQFILALARSHQRLYVEALHAYLENETPFQTLHGRLSASLNRFKDLVDRLGDVESVDIFGQPGKCAAWRKRS